MVFDQALKISSPTLKSETAAASAARTIKFRILFKRRTKGRAYFHWILAAANARKGKPMAEKLAIELADAFNNMARR